MNFGIEAYLKLLYIAIEAANEIVLSLGRSLPACLPAWLGLSVYERNSTRFSKQREGDSMQSAVRGVVMIFELIIELGRGAGRESN